MSKPIDPKRLFGIVIFGLGLFILSLELSREDGFNFGNSLYWSILMFVPGFLFGLSIATGTRLNVVRSILLIAISTLIYYVIIRLFSSQVYRGSWAFQLTVIALGSVLELLVITTLFGLVDKVKWWFYLVAWGIGAISFLFINYPILGRRLSVYPSIVIWQLAMTWLIYFMVGRTKLKMNQSFA